jgi:hypothetical protein
MFAKITKFFKAINQVLEEATRARAEFHIRNKNYME